MTSAIYDITLDAGGDYDIQLTWKDDENNLIDLTGYNARMYIKQKYTSTSFIDCSSYITLGGTDGTIDINIPASVTTTILFTEGVYDLEIYSDTKVYKLLRGRAYINSEVTR